MQPARDTLPNADEIAARGGVPELHLDLHVYSSAPQQRHRILRVLLRPGVLVKRQRGEEPAQPLRAADVVGVDMRQQAAPGRPQPVRREVLPEQVEVGRHARARVDQERILAVRADQVGVRSRPREGGGIQPEQALHPLAEHGAPGKGFHVGQQVGHARSGSRT